MPVSAAQRLQRSQRALRVAFALSLALHAAILFAPIHVPGKVAHAPPRLNTRLSLRAPEPPPEVIEQPEPPPPPTKVPPQRHKPVITRKEGGLGASVDPAPTFSQADRDEMNRFLESLEQEAREQPSLAQHSLAMARQIGREATSGFDEGSVSLEQVPGSPVVDRFSLKLYYRALVDKLNRSKGHVRAEPKQVGYKDLLVQLRLNANGTIRSFDVLSAADQADQIAYIKQVIERAAPYSAFPPDINRSAQSMTIRMRIVPLRGGSDFEFESNY
ncbi:hypothetical protein GCM10025771_06410 [Niveibacterium umoris]|uniref:TonB C-terminal domain-containing protein n=1 Tax=Niveibacterium umoris TaxID=1193620 RepID=A0A840BQ51_9RHOO|nr:hypothetical protein [Niveibacterium umoris]MBB4013812.1 hypothetical protein [Niveibacterium umoris]